MTMRAGEVGQHLQLSCTLYTHKHAQSAYKLKEFMHESMWCWNEPTKFPCHINVAEQDSVWVRL